MLEHLSPYRSAMVAITALLIALAPTARAAEQKALDAGTREALQRALDDTRVTQEFYAAVIARHGKIGPFVGVLEAESRQDQALVALAKANGIDPSSRAAPGKAPAVPESIKDACSAAVDAEKRSVALYDEMIAKVTDGAIRENLESYREASVARQLPAFERCVASGGVVPVVAERCEGCGMVGCGCSEGAKSSQSPASSVVQDTASAGAAAAGASESAPAAKPAHSCGCRRGQ